MSELYGFPNLIFFALVSIEKNCKYDDQGRFNRLGGIVSAK